MNTAQESVVIMKVLCNTHRFSIMNILIHTSEDLCVNELAEILGISQSLTSQQLSYLQARGVIEGVRKGKTICYYPSATPITTKVRRVIQSLS